MESRDSNVVHTESPQVRGGLIEPELYWRDRQPWLETLGYMLRPRYRPGWKPSWEGTNLSYALFEDGVAITHPYIIDAMRISDNSMLTLKKTSKSLHPFEADLSRLFSSEPLSLDPHNHCVPIHDVLQDPIEEDSLILVMPLLRKYDDPRFETIGEAVEFFRQAFEGLQFMHQNHVAHRDIMNLNTMMDPVPLFPEMYHPLRRDRKRDFTGFAKRFPRIERPTTYYFVDFGHARKYNPDDGPPLELPLFGGDRTVPEFQAEGYNKPANPFATDIYYLGNLIREDFLQRYYGLEFLESIVSDMVQNDPSKRPTIEQAFDRFQDVLKNISYWRARRRLVSRKEDILTRLLKDVRHSVRTVRNVVKRRPPIPTPPPRSSS